MTAAALAPELRTRLEELARQAGGVEPLSRRVNIPPRTISRALAGERIQRGTAVLIEQAIAEAPG